MFCLLDRDNIAFDFSIQFLLSIKAYIQNSLDILSTATVTCMCIVLTVSCQFDCLSLISCLLFFRLILLLFGC